MMHARTVVLSVSLLFLFARNAQSEWVLDGNAVTAAPPSRFLTGAISDGAGGAIFAWHDTRTGGSDIYVQRVNGDGNALWTTDGVLMCGATGSQENPIVVSDGAGGAIVAWDDSRSGTRDVYVRRILSTGVPQWTADGVALCTAIDHQLVYDIATDGANGAIVAWRDLRPGTHYDVYARRVNASGTPQWTANGVAVCALPANQTAPSIISDEVGGAIIAWEDNRVAGSDIYVQRLNSAGTALWTANGVALCTAIDSQYLAELVTDGANGAIVAWRDARDGGSTNIFARRVTAAGAPQWFADGIPVCTAFGHQDSQVLVSDGVGGAIIAWSDFRGTDPDIYVQRVTGGGTALWLYDGVALCTAIDNQLYVSIASDGAQGAVVAWDDERINLDRNIYARRILSTGQPIWTFDGSPLCTALDQQGFPFAVPDGTGGAIVGWTDGRGGGQVYAQRVDPRYGMWGRPEPTVVSATDNPNDQGGLVVLRWIASQLDRFYSPGISHYSVWRTTDAIATQALATLVDDPAQIEKDFAGVAVWKETTASGPLYWEWVANQTAFYSQSYSYLTPTRQDSVAGTPATHYFKVIAHEMNFPQTRAWESGSVSGSSFDNLAPPPPIELVGDPTEWDITLTWNNGGVVQDFSHYAVYRANTPALTPTPQFLLGTSEEDLFVDNNVPNGALYYIVTAFDSHGNQSTPSNVWSPPTATPIGDTPSIRALTVLANAPNPFSAGTTVRVGLPAASAVAIEVFDVAGRVVRSDRVGTWEAGWRSWSFDGRDDRGRALASGVYFYRVRASGETVTRKMVIAR